eukprot:6040178-Pleurochrysis_carterae.AAC.2
MGQHTYSGAHGRIRTLTRTHAHACMDAHKHRDFARAAQPALARAGGAERVSSADSGADPHHRLRPRCLCVPLTPRAPPRRLLVNPPKHPLPPRGRPARMPRAPRAHKIHAFNPLSLFMHMRAWLRA